MTLEEELEEAKSEGEFHYSTENGDSWVPVIMRSTVAECAQARTCGGPVEADTVALIPSENYDEENPNESIQSTAMHLNCFHDHCYEVHISGKDD